MIIQKPIGVLIIDNVNLLEVRLEIILAFGNKGGSLVPKAEKGLPITYDVPKRRNGDWDYNTAAPEGYDLSPIGITRTYVGQKTYGNSDSLPIAHSLQYINNRLPDLANRYNLSIDEARMLLGNS